jgi:hypothetical protein
VFQVLQPPTDPGTPRRILAFRNDAGTFVEATAGVLGDLTMVNPRSQWVADFTGDGRADIFVAETGTDTLLAPGGQSRLLVQSADGRLIDESSMRLPQRDSYTHDVAAADIDQDGDLDLAMINYIRDAPRIYVNDGTGHFTDPGGRLPSDVASGLTENPSGCFVDVNRDGFPDLILGGLYYAPNGPLSTRPNILLMNDGTGHFDRDPDFPSPAKLYPEGVIPEIARGDFDGDGADDVLLSTDVGALTPGLQLMLNDGSGRLQDATAQLNLAFSETDRWAVEVEPHDINADGRTDIVLRMNSGNYSPRQYGRSLLINLGNARFVDVSEILTGSLSGGLAVGDIDRDGRLDLVTLHSHQVIVHRSTQSLDLALFADVAPVLTTEPAGRTVDPGDVVEFVVTATGAPTPEIQWRKDGVDLPGATGAILRIAAAAASDAGDYTAVVTNRAGVATSVTAQLTLVPELPATFAAAGYLARNADVAAAIGDVPDKHQRAWRHYIRTGVFEGRTDGDFDVQAYLARYPNLATQFGGDLTAVALHWYTTGRAQGLRVPAGFSIDGYFARNLDVAAYFANDKYGAWLHYYNYGVFEGRSFDTNFIPAEYLELNADLKAALGGDLQGATMHWLQYGHPIEDRMGRVPVGFNIENYFTRYPDLEAAFAGMTPIALRNVAVWNHYIAYGTLEARSDGDFEANNYLATNADLAAVFGTDVRAAAMHWYFYGRREGRRIPPGFDVHNYRAIYPDLEVFTGDDLYGCWLHYRDVGINEGRYFNDLFRPADYLALNPDVAAVLGNNYRDTLLHWLYYGQYEGRQGKF